MTNWPSKRRHERGFSLIELAIALLVIASLAVSALGSVSGQRGVARENRWQAQGETVLDALYGFALRHGRLPCPANPLLASTQDAAGVEDCALEHGVLPWATLAVPELDPWGHRLTYFARRSFTSDPANGARAGFTLSTQGNASIRATAGSASKLADALPAVIVSHGANGNGGYRADGTSAAVNPPDEAENADGDLIFVSHLPAPDFDDHVLWIIPDLLASRLLQAGLLP